MTVEVINPTVSLLVEKIHAICQAFGAFKGAKEDKQGVLDRLADRIIEAERATRGLLPPPPQNPT